MSRDEVSGDFEIDLVMHYMTTAVNEGDRMNVSYAAAKSTIKNVTIQHQVKATTLLQ